MRNYVAFYRGRKIVVMAATSWAAQQAAAKAFKAKKEWEVAIVLADVEVSLVD